MTAARPARVPTVRLILTTAFVVAATVLGAVSPVRADDVVVTAPGDDRLHALAFKASQAERAWRAAGVSEAERLDEYKRAARCDDDTDVEEPGIDQRCYVPPGIEITGPTCEDGPAIAPLWFRFRVSPQAAWSDWEMLVGWSCPEHLLPPVSIEDLRVLHIAPPDVAVQPNDELLVNKPAILHTLADAQAFDTEIAGFDVEIVAEPFAWDWAFDDGERLSTDVPGEPYPSFEVTHTFVTPDQGSVVRLTTSWRGRYRVAADPLHKWRTIDGRATTESSSEPFDVIELRTRLTD